MRKYKLQFLFILVFSLFCVVSCNIASDSSSNANDNDFGIKYSFYLSSTTDQPWASVSGLEGSVVPTINKPEKRGYRFTGWKTKSGDSIPAVFGKERLKFYAQWSESKSEKLIGKKPYPDAVGDVIFTDGSASSYPDNWSDFTDEQWNAAVAMLFTTSYNPTNGQNVKGGQYQYKLAAGLVVSKKQWCVDTIINTRQYDIYALEKDVACYTSLYLGYSWNDILYKKENALQPLSLNSYFGKQHLVDSSVFKAYATSSVAPAFEYVMQYGKNQNISKDFKNDWYLPSSAELTVLFTNPELKQKYNRLLAKKYSFLSDTTSVIYDIKTEFWTSNTYTGQESSEKIYIGHETKNVQVKEEIIYGYLPTKPEEAKKKYPIWMFDPYTGKDEKPFIAASSEYGWFGGGNPGGVKTLADHLTQNEDGSEPDQKDEAAYAHRYVVYTDAYMIDSDGVTNLKKKTTKYAVIPMRVFN